MFSTIFAMTLGFATDGFALPEGRPIPEWAMNAYGDEIEFEVRRKGKKIGEHTVKFTRDGETYYVDTETRLKVKFLFFTAYKLEYKTRETWQGNELVSIDTDTNNNGDKTRFDMGYASKAVTVKDVRKDGVEDTYDLGIGLYPTNHWNPYVLKTEQVMNTISGRPNQVTITPADWEMIEILDMEPRRAMRHDYAGELEDVSAWYDERGRWVGLQFKGGDGSTVSYHCIECGR